MDDDRSRVVLDEAQPSVVRFSRVTCPLTTNCNSAAKDDQMQHYQLKELHQARPGETGTLFKARGAPVSAAWTQAQAYFPSTTARVPVKLQMALDISSTSYYQVRLRTRHSGRQIRRVETREHSIERCIRENKVIGRRTFI